MTSLYLFRHAHTSFPEELIGGRSNKVPLTKKGELQSRELGLWIAANNLTPDYIGVSPAVRTRETARIALNAANINSTSTIEHRLQELTKGDAEGKLRTTYNTPHILARMKSEGNDFKYEGGESYNDAADRLEGWVSEITQTRPEQTIFGFTHGIVTRCLIGRYLGWSSEEFDQRALDNTAATILQFEGTELQGLEFNVSTRG